MGAADTLGRAPIVLSRSVSQGLEEIIRVVRSGGIIIVSELDQETIFYDSRHVNLIQRILTWLADATPSPRIGRSLAGLMRNLGLENVKNQATVLDLPFSMVHIGISGHLETCTKTGSDYPEADLWLKHLEDASAKGEFRGGSILFTVASEKR